MDTAQLLSRLAARDVKLSVEDGRLKCSAPPGALDADLRQALTSRKDDIIAHLKRAAAVAEAPTSIVPIKADGRRRPIFAVSGHGGDIYYMLGLARHLHAEQPMLGVQPPGLDGSAPLTSIEALARYQIDQIRRAQPAGPYLIAGHCAGGTIAFEVAQQLTAAGHEVGLLALIGSPYPTTFHRLPQFKLRILRHVKGLATGTLADRKRYVMTKLRRRLSGETVQIGPSAAMTEARRHVESTTVDAVRAYVPRPYPGRVDLFVTAERWHRSDAWAALAGVAREHIIDGFEIDDLLLGPHVGILSAAVQTRLDELDRRIIEPAAT